MVNEGRSDALRGLVARLDWLSTTGANALRAVGAVVAVSLVLLWLVVTRSWGVVGAFPLLVLLIPAMYLWWFALALDRAVDRTRIEVGVRELVDRARRSVGEVYEARRLRFGLVRVGWRAVQAIRDLRSDLDDLGIDLASWAVVANPGALMAAGISILASVAITVLSLLTVIVALLI